MVPFRVYDREKKEMWIVLNYHSSQSGGSYLVAREDDSDADGEMRVIEADKMKGFRLVDFLDEADDFTD